MTGHLMCIVCISFRIFCQLRFLHSLLRSIGVGVLFLGDGDDNRDGEREGVRERERYEVRMRRRSSSVCIYS